LYFKDISWFPVLWEQIKIRELGKIIPQFDEGYRLKMRSVIERYIFLKGFEEYPPPIQEPGNYKRIRVMFEKKIIVNKILYTLRLFDMVHEHDIKSFFIDLHSGLDIVLSKWDKSPPNPRNYHFICRPSKVLVTPKLLKRKPIDDLDGWAPYRSFEKVWDT
jgi:hypothetical protein